MTFSKHTRLIALFISTLVVGACTADTSLRGRVESYLNENIAELSPRSPTQGEFRVTDIEWIDDKNIRVEYEDEAGVRLHATAKVNDTGNGNGTKLVHTFRIEDKNTSSSSSSSTSSMSSTSRSSTSTTKSSSMSDDDDDDDESSSSLSSRSSSTSAMSSSSSSFSS